MSIRLQVGDVVRFKDSDKWRTVKHIRYNSKGEQLVGLGYKPVGFSMAKDMIVQPPVQLKFDKINTSTDDFYRQNPIVSAMILDGFMNKDVDTFADGMRMFMNE